MLCLKRVEHFGHNGFQLDSAAIQVSQKTGAMLVPLEGRLFILFRQYENHSRIHKSSPTLSKPCGIHPHEHRIRENSSHGAITPLLKPFAFSCPRCQTRVTKCMPISFNIIFNIVSDTYVIRSRFEASINAGGG